jgi:hypothetical protein
MVGGVPHRVQEDRREGVDPPKSKLAIGDVHQYWEKGFPDQCEVVVRGLSFEGGEGLVRLLEEERDCFVHHDLDQFSRDQARSVDDCHNYNEGEGVSSGKLMGLGAFGDTAELVRSCNDYSSLCVFLVSCLSLISMAGRRWGAPKTIILSTKKSSIDGN